MISSSFSNCHQFFIFLKMRSFVGRLFTSNYVNCQSLVWISHITDYYSPSLCQTNKTIPSVCWKSAIILVSFHVKDCQNAKIANSQRKEFNFANLKKCSISLPEVFLFQIDRVTYMTKCYWIHGIWFCTFWHHSTILDFCKLHFLLASSFIIFA